MVYYISKNHLALSSSGLGRHPLTVKISGSKPLRVTKFKIIRTLLFGFIFLRFHKIKEIKLFNIAKRNLCCIVFKVAYNTLSHLETSQGFYILLYKTHPLKI